MKKRKNVWIVILIAIPLLLVSLCAWYVFSYMPIFPQNVDLPSGIYLPAPGVYLHSEVKYDPLHPPLDAGISRLQVDRSSDELAFYFSDGELLIVPLGKRGRVSGCEKQFGMQYFQLGIAGLSLGPVVIHDPILLVACDMWARSEKIRPAKLILREGPLPKGTPFFLGANCGGQDDACLYFGQAYGSLTVRMIDVQTGKLVHNARIILENENGIREYDGGFDLQLYAGVQVQYHLTAPGYPDITGMISNSNGAKLFVSMLYGANQTSGYSDIFDMPQYGRTIEYTFKLGESPYSVPTPLIPTPLPTSSSSATPVPD